MDEEHILQGRLKPAIAKTQRLFGSLATTTGADGWITPTKIVGTWRTPCECVGCGAWSMSTAAMEILRSSDEIDLLPLDFSLFASNALPAGAFRTARSQVKLRVSAEASTTYRQWYMDVGQTIELNADCVCVDYVVPENFYEVPGQVPSPAGRRGLVADVNISVGISRIEAPIGMPTVTYTTNLYVAANTQVTTTIPPFATEVTIYQTTSGGASGPWTQWYGDPSMGIEAGHLPFIVGARRTQQETVLPDTTHLETDQDAVDRFFTLRWTIRP